LTYQVSHFMFRVSLFPYIHRSTHPASGTSKQAVITPFKLIPTAAYDPCSSDNRNAVAVPIPCAVTPIPSPASSAPPNPSARNIPGPTIAPVIPDKHVIAAASSGDPCSARATSIVIGVVTERDSTDITVSRPA
jgi:hypothetical protein